jgi:hypothetical protein
VWGIVVMMLHNPVISDIDSRTIKVTFFKTEAAQSLRTANLTLPQLRDKIITETAASKMELPWLKLAIFGNKRTDKKCLRSNENTKEITGIETDYDAGRIPFDDAIKTMQRAGVRCLLYTSASHVAGAKERWRILVPLSQNFPPDAREKMVARINGLFDGQLAPESFVLSQAYLFGNVENPDHRAVVLDGDFLDLRLDLYAGSIFKDGSKVGDQECNTSLNGADRNADHAPHLPRDHDPLPVDRAKVEAALAVISSNCSYETWRNVGGALHHEFGESGFDIFDTWSATSPQYDAADCKERWRGVRSMREYTGATIFYLADQAEPGWRDQYEIDALLRICADLYATTTKESKAAADDRQPQPNCNSDNETVSPKPATVDPVDLWGKFKPPSLPRGILPDVIERFAFDQGMDMGADMSGIAMSALAVCAATIPDNVQLQVKRHNPDWLESARLWVALVGAPSAKKTPIIRVAARPLLAIDREQARGYAERRTAYDKLPKEEKQHVDPPKQVRSVLQDTTVEAAQEVFKDSPDGMLCYQDELSGWFGAMDKYSAGRGSAKDRAFWLEAYNGGSYSVLRVGRGSVFIPNLSATLIGGIQPEPIRQIANDSVDDGLLQRLLPISLASAMAGRDEEASEVVEEYQQLVRKLHGIGEVTLRFDDGAQRYRQELEVRHLKLQSLECIHRKLAAHIGKYDGIFARLCVVWHCVENVRGFGMVPSVITEQTAKHVGAFLHGFLLPHAMAFYVGVLGLGNDHDSMTAIAGYILAHNLMKITNRDLKRGDQIMRRLDPDQALATFEQLEALGWLDRVPSPRHGKPSHWIVTPLVHWKFAERAKSEAARRAEVRQIISEAMGGSGDI